MKTKTLKPLTERQHILMFNDKQFIKDLKSVRDVMAFVGATKQFFNIRKLDIKRAAQTNKIHYYMSDEVFRNRRIVMVVI